MPVAARYILLLLTPLAVAQIARPGIAQDARFPYVAYVARHDVSIHSGPAQSHYPTTTLPLGYAVEVYRHDVNGMCAIRPPEGSFSLIPSHHVSVLDAQTARIIADFVASSVGSRLSNEQDAVQVFLRKGETVELVEPPQRDAPWVRIAPPAGEFRWISARHIARTPPTELDVESGDAQGVDRRWRPQNSDPLARSNSDGVEESDALDLLRRRCAPHASQSAQSRATLDANANDTFHHLATENGYKVIAGSPAQLQLVQFQQETAPRPESPMSTAPALAAPPFVDSRYEATATRLGRTAPFSSASPSDAPTLHSDSDGALAGPTPNQNATTTPRVRFPGISPPPPIGTPANSGAQTDHLGDLELYLSQTVVQPPATWRLAGLRSETAAQLATTTDPIQRAGWRDLLERIAVFEQVQRRYIEPTPFPLRPSTDKEDPFGPIGADSSGAEGAAPGITSETNLVRDRVRRDLDAQTESRGATKGQTEPTTEPEVAEARYAAVGTLKPVASSRRDAPRYALVDDDGNVVSFLTASPDLNLQAYVGQKIGVAGTRGFMPEYRQAHVVAGRITRLVR